MDRFIVTSLIVGFWVWVFWITLSEHLARKRADAEAWQEHEAWLKDNPSAVEALDRALAEMAEERERQATPSSS